MDRITKAAVDKVLADLAENGGGTYQYGTFLPFTPPTGDGYAVAVGGITLPASKVTADVMAWSLRIVAGEFMTSFVGTWLNEGTVYIDGVVYFAARNKADACLLAIAKGQEAIYDFATGESISMPKEASL